MTLQPLGRVQREACPRCQGRMMPYGSEGDRACFTCGNVVYMLPPLDRDERKRRPSRGGVSLD